jgi:hypothetical protein
MLPSSPSGNDPSNATEFALTAVGLTFESSAHTSETSVTAMIKLAQMLLDDANLTSLLQKLKPGIGSRETALRNDFLKPRFDKRVIPGLQRSHFETKIRQ